MPTQKILLGDCLDVFANEKNVPAFVSDPPANIGFMGRSWDRAHPVNDFVLPMPARSKEHERELRREESFIRYWATRYAMAYDIADKHAVNIVWTLPRTSYQTATALRRAGWDIRDNLVHLFGTGLAKTGNALAPGQEGWLLATKGKPDLDIDACRVPRGGESTERTQHRGLGYGGSKDVDRVNGGHPRGSLPKNALLSHCEECVRVGVKRVRNGGGPPCMTGSETTANAYGKFAQRSNVTHRSYNGTESVPAYHCLAGCVCGARSVWEPEQPLPRCPCGETWRWLCAVAEVNGQSGDRPGMTGGGKHREGYEGGMFGGIDCTSTLYGGNGGAARFFNTFSYLSKCSSSERHAGCENLFWRANKKTPFGFDQVTREEWETLATDARGQGKKTHGQTTDHGARDGTRAQGNVHPTVKSYRLISWHHRIAGATRILDLTAGSGTGMYTALLDGIEWFGAEVCPEAITIAEARYAFWKGLSFQARDAFMHDDIVAQPNSSHALQQSLF